MQGFSIFRLLRSYNSYLNARGVAANMVEFFIDLHNDEGAHLICSDITSPSPNTTEAVTSTQNNLPWPLPMVTDLRKAVFQQQSFSAENSQLYLAESSGKPGEETTMSRLVRAVHKGGSLIAVVGPIGAGKTTLLTELMSHMRLSPGEHDKSLAYTSQRPWIPRGSLASIITFTEEGCSKAVEAEDEWLSDVIDGCGLRQDLAGI